MNNTRARARHVVPVDAEKMNERVGLGDCPEIKDSSTGPEIGFS
jgi:hypothetical protein